MTKEDKPTTTVKRVGKSSSDGDKNDVKKEEKVQKEEVKETKEVNRQQPVRSTPTRRAPVQNTKNATCIRLFGIVFIAVITFVMWSHFNQVDYDTVDTTLFLKGMPIELLKHYQLGSFIPVYHRQTKKQIKVFMVSSDTVVDDYYQNGGEPAEPVPANKRILPPSSDTTILMLHGMAGSSFSFRKELLELHRDHNIRSIAIDLPCHGFSDRLPTSSGAYNCSYQHVAQSIGDILDALQLSKVHLLMYDHGSVYGSYFYNSNPKRVKSLTFVDPVMDVDIQHQPLYIKAATFPIINRALLLVATSPYVSFIRNIFTRDVLKVSSESLTRGELDSYFYLLRFKNNINNYIRSIQDSDMSFKTSYELQTSRLSYDQNTHRLLILSSSQTKYYQSQYFQSTFRVDHTDIADASYLLLEELPKVFSNHLPQIIDKIDGEDVRKVHYSEIEISKGGGDFHGHGHSHGGDSHGHSHGGADYHGHSHGGSDSHGHSHGSGESHGHSHGSDSHGHSHGSHGHGHSH